MNHTIQTPKTCDFDHNSGRNCPCCDGGLMICTVCGAFEGGLATECPGRQISYAETDLIYQKRLDFKEGQWVLIQAKEAPTLAPNLGLVRPVIEPCPHCAQDRGIPVLYGKLDASGRKKVAAGHARAGGCVLDAKSPTHGCRVCIRTWIDETSPQWEERQVIFQFLNEAFALRGPR